MDDATRSRVIMSERLEEAPRFTKSGHRVKRPGLAVWGRITRDGAGRVIGLKPISFGQTDAAVQQIEEDHWSEVVTDEDRREVELGLEVEVEGGGPFRLFYGVFGLRRVDLLYYYPEAPLPEVSCVLVELDGDEDEIDAAVRDFSTWSGVWKAYRTVGRMVEILYPIDFIKRWKGDRP